MGWSPLDPDMPSDESVIGDESFDLVSECFRQVAAVYKRDIGRKPSLRELVGTAKAVLAAQLQDHTSDGDTAELTGLTFKTKPVPRRQKFAVGDVLRAKAANDQPIFGRVFEIDPALGPLVGVYDSLAMSQRDLDAIIRRPLIVRIFPIHREILEQRGWLVVGNRPIAVKDEKLPRGPLHISGVNEQLEAANYYYGLGPAPFRDVDDLIVRRSGGG